MLLNCARSPLILTLTILDTPLSVDFWTLRPMGFSLITIPSTRSSRRNRLLYCGYLGNCVISVVSNCGHRSENCYVGVSADGIKLTRIYKSLVTNIYSVASCEASMRHERLDFSAKVIHDVGSWRAPIMREVRQRKATAGYHQYPSLKLFKPQAEPR